MENETVIQKVNRLHKEVVGFDKIDKCKQEDIEVYLQYNSEELKELTENECELISIKLLQHSLYVQRKLNCIKAAQDWLLYELRKIIARDIQNIKGVGKKIEDKISEFLSTGKIPDNTFPTPIPPSPTPSPPARPTAWAGPHQSLWQGHDDKSCSPPPIANSPV
jgi:hypothetical protein